MVEAAWTAVRFEPHWQQIFDRLRQKRGSSVAIVAVARKLLVVCWFLLHDHATYFYLNPQRYIRKLQEWAWKMWLRHSAMRPKRTPFSIIDCVRASLVTPTTDA